MKNVLRTLVVGAGAALILALSVETAAAWSCRAVSGIAEGWGYSPVLQTAREEARLQCMLKTKKRLACRVVMCRK